MDLKDDNAVKIWATAAHESGGSNIDAAIAVAESSGPKALTALFAGFFAAWLERVWRYRPKDADAEGVLQLVHLSATKGLKQLIKAGENPASPPVWKNTWAEPTQAMREAGRKALEPYGAEQIDTNKELEDAAAEIYMAMTKARFEP